MLVWGFADLIHPDYVLESPVEVGTFAINPGQPNVVAGGCITGQVMLWDCSKAEVGGQLRFLLDSAWLHDFSNREGRDGILPAGPRCTVGCGKENGDGCKEGPGCCAPSALVICGALPPRPYHGPVLVAGRILDARGQSACHGKELHTDDFQTFASTSL